MNPGRLILLALLLMLPAAFPALADAEDLRQALEAPSAELDALDLPAGELNSFYALHEDEPAWDFLKDANAAQTSAFIDSLEQMILYHGLQKEDYPLDPIRKLTTAADDRDRARLDTLVTASILRLAHDLHGDNIDLGNDYPGWNFHRAEIYIPKLLAAALAKNGVGEFIGGLAPKNPAYAKLASGLRVYRSLAAEGGWKAIDPGGPLRPKDRNPRVRQLRARLAAEGFLPAADLTGSFFDADLQKALQAYQTRNGLDPDGHAGRKTLEALNVPVAFRIDQIRANMERWRHMPEDFPSDRYAIINIADAGLMIVEDGKEIYRGPVVVGKVDRKTPFIQSHVRSMIVNPFWHVPTKIAQKDILPKLKKDPHYLEKLGFVISGHAGDPYGETIDWASMPEQEFNFRLRQAPGDQNSLGHLKFDFDNDFAVYMHGTPHQELFAKSQRNFSSGCIRLRDPDLIGEILLKDTPGSWDRQKIGDEVEGGQTRWVGIKNPMPLYVLYWSVFVDPASGAIHFRKDVYDYDRIFEPAPRVANSDSR
jgi:L,D-transpeptidase YcbB